MPLCTHIDTDNGVLYVTAADVTDCTAQTRSSLSGEFKRAAPWPSVTVY